MLCFGTFVFLSNISKFELMGPVLNCLEGGEVTSSEVCCGFNYDPGLEDEVVARVSTSCYISILS